MTRHRRMKHKLSSPERAARRKKRRPEAARPQIYKKHRLSSEQVLALFSRTKRAELSRKAEEDAGEE